MPQVPGLKLRIHDLEQRLSLAETDAEDAKSRLQVVSADASRGYDLSKSVAGELQSLRKRASELEVHLRQALDEGEQARIVADSSAAELEKLRNARAQLLHENRALVAEINEKRLDVDAANMDAQRYRAEAARHVTTIKDLQASLQSYAAGAATPNVKVRVSIDLTNGRGRRAKSRQPQVFL